ncbi:hypothetical protein [Streptomyces sp. NPDC060187]|uniref:hypothetical protein n=1 Tax=Streptomyces sp. NPDC060187 TaxID=3347067 RepID=UPI003661F7E5
MISLAPRPQRRLILGAGVLKADLPDGVECAAAGGDGLLLFHAFAAFLGELVLIHLDGLVVALDESGGVEALVVGHGVDGRGAVGGGEAAGAHGVELVDAVALLS